MIRLAAIVLALQLAQLQVATFDVCYLDVNASPYELRPDPKGRTAQIVIGHVIGWVDISPRYGGIDCVQISAGGNRAYVIGTLAEVCAKLGVDPTAEACGSD